MGAKAIRRFLETGLVSAVAVAWACADHRMFQSPLIGVVKVAKGTQDNIGDAKASIAFFKLKPLSLKLRPVSSL
jgi:hypothetical protein